MRIALGCMRLSTDPEVGESHATSVLERALMHGVATFDTARAYGRGEQDLGANEALLARVLRKHGSPPTRVVTKCGMRRDGGGWIPDGRARTIAEDAEASVAALGKPPDLLLLHAPDPRVALETTARALARALDRGFARAIGVSNVTRKDVEEIARHVPVSAIEASLGAWDDSAVRRALVDWCRAHDAPLYAYAPLGGPERARKLARDETLAAIAARKRGGLGGPLDGCDVFLAYLLTVDPLVVPVVGARSPDTVDHFVTANTLVLDDEDLRALDARFPVLASAKARPRLHATRAPSPTSSASVSDDVEADADAADVVLLMGLQGAGKSRAARVWVERGYERLNRDQLGGTLRGIAKRLDDRLRAGGKRFVLDNTYVTRESRSDVLRVARAHGARVRCVYYEVTVHDAQVNVVRRMLETFGHVLSPAEIAAHARRAPEALAPTALFRMQRDLEAPREDEGFSAIETMAFRRDTGPDATPARFVSLDTLVARADTEWCQRVFAGAAEPCLVYAWRPGATAEEHATQERWVRETLATVSGAVELAFCTHPAGPPVCWCRPPLPALFVDFAHRHRVSLEHSVLHGTTAADRNIARAIGARLSEDVSSG